MVSAAVSVRVQETGAALGSVVPESWSPMRAEEQQADGSSGAGSWVRQQGAPSSWAKQQPPQQHSELVEAGMRATGCPGSGMQRQR
jgi:hypothetical protein